MESNGATFWQIETKDERDFNGGCRGVGLATIDATAELMFAPLGCAEKNV
jgi:hypothetical protein